MTMIEVLREEHRNIGRLLRALDHQIDVFAAAEAPDYDVIVGVADYFLDYPDRCHHPKEDLIISRLREAHPAAAAKVGDLSGEHKALHQKAHRFRETVRLLLNDTDIARSQVVEAARAFIDAQWRHLRSEEASFLPLAERLLTATDLAAIEDRLSKSADPVFGGRVEAMFATLSARLLAWESE